MRRHSEMNCRLDRRFVEEDGDGPHLPLLVDPVQVVDVEVFAESLEL